MRWNAVLLLLALAPAARGQAFTELLNLADSAPGAARPAESPAAASPVSARKACPADWEEKKAGGCWTDAQAFDGEGAVEAYVHPAGWLVDPRCLQDARFSAREFLDALTVAARKMDPALPAEAGGCLGSYNPEWGRELKEQVWKNRVRVQCPQDYDRSGWTCADEGSRDASLPGKGYRKDYSRMITIRNVKGCTGPGSSGLAGTLFHETLHAAGADNVSIETHNSRDRPQLEFIRDRVYGTEATCFFGAKANLIQCRTAVAYEAVSPRYELCRGFSATFTDMPSGMVK